MPTDWLNDCLVGWIDDDVKLFEGGHELSDGMGGNLSTQVLGVSRCG